ncbi:MAG TPA: cupin domain-containing protein [Pyrinomonadaceae bacterium]|jgi:quercetin dioxygenase-like cupin family protein
MKDGARDERRRGVGGPGGPLHVNWSEVPAEPAGEGVERQMVVGRRIMLCRLRFAPNVVTPVHEHPHEQMTIVERGRVRFFIEGGERVASAGDVLHFPPGCRHGATMLDEEVVLVDIFSPPREDFLATPSASTPRTDEIE